MGKACLAIVAEAVGATSSDDYLAFKIMIVDVILVRNPSYCLHASTVGRMASTHCIWSIATWDVYSTYWRFSMKIYDNI